MVEEEIFTQNRAEFLRLDAQLKEILARAGWRDGLFLVHVPHTTAGVTLNENGDPDVPRDLLLRLDRLAQDPDYRHAEGNSAAHLQASLCGCQVWVPVQGGRLKLGRWQSVWFCEFDGPRRRQVWVEWIPGGLGVQP